jgi:hypothetical protein
MVVSDLALRFDGSTKPPTFSQGFFPLKGNVRSSRKVKSLFLVPLHATSAASFIASLRPICEYLYFVLLTCYKDGMEAFRVYQCSQKLEEEQNQRPLRGSTPAGAWIIAQIRRGGPRFSHTSRCRSCRWRHRPR